MIIINCCHDRYSNSLALLLPHGDGQVLLSVNTKFLRTLGLTSPSPESTKPSRSSSTVSLFDSTSHKTSKITTVLTLYVLDLDFQVSIIHFRVRLMVQCSSHGHSRLLKYMNCFEQSICTGPPRNLPQSWSHG